VRALAPRKEETGIGMPSQRDAIRMTDQEIAAHLAGLHKLQLATINPDGTPHLVTMYYDLFADGRIGFWTYGQSQKVRNLERDPRLTCLVEAGEGYDELRGVQIVGAAEIVRDREQVRDIGARVYGRYNAGGRPEELQPFIDQQARKRVGVFVHPAAVASWDHRKLGG
jgi:PPOX class probable F420-dependent enzyme